MGSKYNYISNQTLINIIPYKIIANINKLGLSIWLNNNVYYVRYDTVQMSIILHVNFQQKVW